MRRPGLTASSSPLSAFSCGVNVLPLQMASEHRPGSFVQQASQDQVRVVKAVPGRRKSSGTSAWHTQHGRHPWQADRLAALGSSVLEFLDSRGGVLLASSHGPHPQQASSCHRQRDCPAATHRLRSFLLRDLHSAKARRLMMLQREFREAD